MGAANFSEILFDMFQTLLCAADLADLNTFGPGAHKALERNCPEALSTATDSEQLQTVRLDINAAPSLHLFIWCSSKTPSLDPEQL